MRKRISLGRMLKGKGGPAFLDLMNNLDGLIAIFDREERIIPAYGNARFGCAPGDTMPYLEGVNG